MNWKKLLLTALAAGAFLSTGAGAQGTLRIGLNDDPDGLDPALSRSYSVRLTFAAVCDKLFDITPDIKIVPMLATGFTWAKDGMSVVIKLRPGVKFHDGEPFNAEAVRYNFDRNLNLKGSFRRAEINAVKSVDVVDNLTVRLNLSEPSTPLIAALTDRAGMMISPKAGKELGDKFGTKPVCAGPYRFVERIAQGRIVFERFKDYWDKANVHYDRVVYTPITDSTVRMSALRSGELDIIERMSPSELSEVRKDNRLKVASVPELGYQVIRYNINNGPRGKLLGEDPRVREAIEAAIDRETLVKVVFNNEYIAGNQWVQPKNYYYNSAFPVPKRDVAKARALLARAGKSGFTFNLIVPPERDRQEAAQVIQSMLAEAGITMNIVSQENVTMLTSGTKGEFDAYFTFWSGRPDPDGNIYQHFACGSRQNDPGYCNKELDQFTTKARQVASPAERKKLYDQATELFLRDRPVLILWHRNIFTGHNVKVRGFVPYPDGVIRIRGLKGA
jgi:peptide/nickel transport system substrate-binding protein